MCNRSPQAQRVSDSIRMEVAIPAWKLNIVSQDPCYHGEIRLDMAIKLLKQHGGNHSFLIRYSTTGSKYMLVVMTQSQDGKDSYHQFNILIDGRDGGVTTCEIEGSERRFDSISDLLEYYKVNAVSNKLIRGIGRPVCRGTHEENKDYLSEDIVSKKHGHQSTL